MNSSAIHKTAIISKKAKLGARVRVGPFSIIEAGVVLGPDCVIESHCHIGYGSKPGVSTQIGAGALVRTHSIIYADVHIGMGLKTGHHATIREKSSIGERFQLGSYGDVQGYVDIGHDVRTQSHVYICQYSKLGDYVWMFPGAMLANDPHPPSDVCTRGPKIGRYAVLGMGAMVLAHVNVGDDAVIAAGAVVRADVAAGDLVAGVPAKKLGLAKDVKARDAALKQVYPWRLHFQRGYPEGLE